MDIKTKEKIITGLEKNARVYIKLESGTYVQGLVEDVEFCCNLHGDSWHIIHLKHENDLSMYDSRNISEVLKVISSDDDDVLICKNMFETDNVPYGLDDPKFLNAVIENWSDYDELKKLEIAEIIACSMDSCLLKAILDTHSYLINQYKEVYRVAEKAITEKETEDTKVGTIGNAIKNLLLIACAASAAKTLAEEDK